MTNRRKLREEKLMKKLAAGATFSVIALLLFIIGVILVKGAKALSFTMLFELPKGGFYYGGEGGIANAIVGSLYIAIGATLLAVIIGMPVALFINVYLIKYKRTQSAIRYFLDTLWGIPSIVYGAFGFTVMLYIGMSSSLLAGIVTVALLITPILVRTFDDVLCTIPRGLYEASFALGSGKSETAFNVIFRQGFSGFITALLLAFGRGIGDAASVLFTAGYTDLIPEHLDEPAATLPLAIFFQLGSPIPEVRERAFASAAVLTLIILLTSLIARYLSKRYSINVLK
ncbi:MAG: ABC transporter permease subunit [bacterium]